MESVAQEKVILNKLAEAAMTLLKPPYNRGCGIFTDNKERKDWETLRRVLIEAGYAWEEYT